MKMKDSKDKKSLAQRLDAWVRDNLPVAVTIVTLIVLGAFVSIFQYQAVYDVAEAIGTVTGLISLIVAIITWYSIRRMRNAFNPARPKQLIGDDVSILCVTCKGSNIAGDVAHFVRTSLEREALEALRLDVLTEEKTLGEFKTVEEVPNRFSAEFITDLGGFRFGHGRFIDVTMSGTMPFDAARHYTAYFAVCMEELFSRLKSMGVSKFKVFYCGPVMLPAVIGYIAKNNVAIELYHYDGGSAVRYTSMGAMQLSWREDMIDVPENAEEGALGQPRSGE